MPKSEKETLMAKGGKDGSSQGPQKKKRVKVTAYKISMPEESDSADSEEETPVVDRKGKEKVDNTPTKKKVL